MPKRVTTNQKRKHASERELGVNRRDNMESFSPFISDGFDGDVETSESAPVSTTLIEDAASSIAISDGKVVDFISGQLIKPTPEEIQATQIFSRNLVEDYGYLKEQLQTRPQFRVKARPSDGHGDYPVDIAIFSGIERSEQTLIGIVECKRKSRKDGRKQLEDYLRLSPARFGVWFNGSERLFLRKTERSGRVLFNEIPNIPKAGQRLEDVGLYLRNQLAPTANLRSVFRAIRNFLAANAVGITRDEVFAQQIINLLFCKIYDERFTRQDAVVSFRAGLDEDASAVKERVVVLFEKVKKQYSDVIGGNDSIDLDPRSIMYVVGELQMYELVRTDRDVIADAFEIFIGPSLKGSQGQFFTPRNVVKMVIDMLDPKPNERLIDPACGSGGFLVEALRHVWRHVEQQGAELDWPSRETEDEKKAVAVRIIRGIDKDSFLSKVAKAYMAILGDGRGGVFSENSLDKPSSWSRRAQEEVQLGSFDVVVTNPPFGKKLAISDRDLLSQFDLGHNWKSEKGTHIKLEVADKQSPQILFIERCLDLLRPGGRLGIVLLESIFGMPKYRHIVEYLVSRTTIRAIVALPEDLFQPYTHAKTCVVILEKTSPSDTYDMFMCDVKVCGHDSRGNPTYRLQSNGEKLLIDEVPQVAALFHAGNSRA